MQYSKAILEKFNGKTKIIKWDGQGNSINVRKEIRYISPDKSILENTLQNEIYKLYKVFGDIGVFKQIK